MKTLSIAAIVISTLSLAACVPESANQSPTLASEDDAAKNVSVFLQKESLVNPGLFYLYFATEKTIAKLSVCETASGDCLKAEAGQATKYVGRVGERNIFALESPVRAASHASKEASLVLVRRDKNDVPFSQSPRTIYFQEKATTPAVVSTTPTTPEQPADLAETAFLNLKTTVLEKSCAGGGSCHKDGVNEGAFLQNRTAMQNQKTALMDRLTTTDTGRLMPPTWQDTIKISDADRQKLLDYLNTL